MPMISSIVLGMLDFYRYHECIACQELPFNIASSAIEASLPNDALIHGIPTFVGAGEMGSRLPGCALTLYVQNHFVL